MDIMDCTPGRKVRLPDDDEPGFVDNVDFDEDIVFVLVRGSYDHLNSIIDIDPDDLEPWED